MGSKESQNKVISEWSLLRKEVLSSWIKFLNYFQSYSSNISEFYSSGLPCFNQKYFYNGEPLGSMHEKRI